MEDMVSIHKTDIDGAYTTITNSIKDQRGFFYRAYCERELMEITSNKKICQINISNTKKKGTIRGLHFQIPPDHEMKLVRCIRGRVWDVIVDLRTDSPTFLNWYAEELNPKDKQMMIVPEGCAHGFQVLEDNSELLYLHTAFYNSNNECGIRYNDPRINIKWPLPPVSLSERDQKHPLINKGFNGYKL